MCKSHCYMKWTFLGGLYSITEIYMLADRPTGAFEENIQYSTYLPESAGARICEASFSTIFYCKHHSDWSVISFFTRCIFFVN